MSIRACVYANVYVFNRMWGTEREVRHPFTYNSLDYFIDTVYLTKSGARLTWQNAPMTYFPMTFTVMGSCEVWYMETGYFNTVILQSKYFLHSEISISKDVLNENESPISTGWSICFQIGTENCICLSWVIIFRRNINLKAWCPQLVG